MNEVSYLKTNKFFEHWAEQIRKVLSVRKPGGQVSSLFLSTMPVDDDREKPSNIAHAQSRSSGANSSCPHKKAKKLFCCVLENRNLGFKKFYENP